jgi:hypothetical protein
MLGVRKMPRLNSSRCSSDEGGVYRRVRAGLTALEYSLRSLTHFGGVELLDHP